METFRFSPFFYLSLFLSIFLSVFVHLLSFDCLVFSLLLMLMRARRSINIQRWKHSGRLFIRVTDPHSFDPDPIRIQGFDGQRLEKIYNWKKNYIFWSKTALYLFLGIHKGRSSYRSLHPSKENILHLKTWISFTFVGHFEPPGSGSVLPMRIRIQPTNTNSDPSSDTQHRFFTYLSVFLSFYLNVSSLSIVWFFFFFFCVFFPLTAARYRSARFESWPGSSLSKNKDEDWKFLYIIVHSTADSHTYNIIQKSRRKHTCKKLFFFSISFIPHPSLSLFLPSLSLGHFRQNQPLMYREILSMLKPGESVAKALRRLGGGTKVKNS